MAGEALDIKGWAVGNTGLTGAVPGNQFYLPMLPGCQLLESPELYPTYLAQGLIDAATWTQGVKKPALVLRTPLFGGGASTKNWFNTTRLANCLIPNSAGVIATDFASAFQFQYADDATNAFREYTNAKLASLSLTWGGDSPIIAEMLLVFYGTENDTSPGTAISSSAGAGTQLTGPYLMSQGVTYAGTLADVVSGSLSLLPGLVPDLTTPLVNAPNGTTGESLPNNYFNAGPPVVSLQVTQKKVGSPTVVDPSPQNVGGQISIVFNDVLNSAATTFGLRSLKPVPGRSVNIGLALVSRAYRNIKPATGTAAYSIS